MRKSNYLFTKGAIVFINPTDPGRAYLKGRPLIAVSYPIPVHNTIQVCTTGTSDQPGILISLYNYHTKTFCGNTEVSKAYPHDILTISVDEIVGCIGYLDHYIMKEIDDAISFFRDGSTPIPGYLKTLEDEICGVSYNPIKSYQYTHQMISPNLAQNSNEILRNDISKNSEESSSTKKSLGKVWDINESVIVKESVSSKKSSSNKKSLVVDDWGDLSKINSEDIEKNCRDEVALVKMLDERSVAMIVSRARSIATISEKFNIKDRYAIGIRSTLTNVAIKMAHLMLKSKGVIRSKNPPDYILIGMLLIKAFAPEEIPNNAIDIYSERILEVTSKYNINLMNKRTWKSFEISKFD